MIKSKWGYLDYLYNKINRQQPISFQWQCLRDGEKWFSKRRSYEELCFDKDDTLNQWWLERINARNILLTEICLDYDPSESVSTFDIAVCVPKLDKRIREYIKATGIEAAIHLFDTTSKGIHYHIFIESMKYLSEKERQIYRNKFINLFPIEYGDNVLYADRLKISENVMINLEYSKHWKTGKVMKEMKI